MGGCPKWLYVPAAHVPRRDTGKYYPELELEELLDALLFDELEDELDELLDALLSEELEELLELELLLSKSALIAG